MKDAAIRTVRPEFWHDISRAHLNHTVRDGIPSFHTLDRFRPRTAALIHGLVLSTAVFSVTCFAIRYNSIHVLHMRMPEIQLERLRSSPASFQPTLQPKGDSVTSALSEKAAVPLRSESQTRPGPATPRSSISHSFCSSRYSSSFIARAPGSSSRRRSPTRRWWPCSATTCRACS